MRPSLGEELVPAAAFETLTAVAARLPLSTGGVSLETHLGRGEPRVDLVVRLFRPDRAVFSQTEDAWLEPVRRFVAGWSLPDGGLSHVTYADVEIDLDGEALRCFVGAMIEPRFAGGLRAIRKERLASASATPSSCFDVGARVLEVAEAEPIDTRVIDGVRRCFDSLGADAFVGYIGSLRTRTGRGDLVRMITSMPRSEVRAFLGAIGWPGDVDALQRGVRRLLGDGDRLDLDLNVTRDGVTAETGFYQTFWDPTAEVTSLQRSLAWLVEDGLVSTQQSTALARFAAHELEPLGAPRTLTLKLKVSATGAIQAKVYLSLLSIE
ncbi:MAG: hypothetical protein HOV80_04350 [Polyangiaceae bacterium]|nr:hypothetical protein [Polyangiaceae bacterium]